MIRIRVSADDLNQILGMCPDVHIVWRDGCFVIERKLGPVVATARAYPDVRHGHLRLAVSFDGVRTQRGIRLAGIAGAFWSWLEARIESDVGTRLAKLDLPWDLVWLERRDDAEHGAVGTINVSPRTLNEWLSHQPWLGPLAFKLKGVEPDADGFVFELLLQPRAT